MNSGGKESKRTSWKKRRVSDLGSEDGRVWTAGAEGERCSV